MENKRIYSAVKVMKCPRCRQVTKHKLYDYKYLIYKCTQCNNIHI